MVEYLSIYSKDYLLSYHTHIPVSSFGTKKMQRKRFSLCMHMAVGGIKGLIYLEARACFSVHSGIHFRLVRPLRCEQAGRGGDLGHAPPGKFFKMRHSEIASEATFGPKCYYNHPTCSFCS